MPTSSALLTSFFSFQFDIFSWFPSFNSCQKYFLDHAQHSSHVQAVAAFINIHLPYQRSINLRRFSPSSLPNPTASPSPNDQTAAAISLTPYLRRLVVTGLDFPGVLHGFFGDDWQAGIGPMHEQERRNYLFAAKSGGWASVKKDYDMGPLETVPFMRPLQGTVVAEIEAAERGWSDWLAMEDWMVGPRAPEGLRARGHTQSSIASHHGGRGGGGGGGGMSGGGVNEMGGAQPTNAGPLGGGGRTSSGGGTGGTGNGTQGASAVPGDVDASARDTTMR